MNIFVTSSDPKACAYVLDDLRVNKMVLETAQLLSGAVRYFNADASNLYKPTHMGHPCAVWTRIARDNFLWLIEHGRYLNDVFKLVSGRDHACLNIINLSATYSSDIVEGSMTRFKNCTNYKHITDVHEAYRLQMIDKWNEDLRPPTWRNRNVPDWYVAT